MEYAAARAYADTLRRRLTRAFARAGAPVRIRIVGSLRRKAPIAGDIDLLVVGADVPDLTVADAALARAGLVAENRGERKRTYGRGPLSVDIFAATTAEMPFALFHYTGPRSYNIRIRRYAKLRGLRLNQYGVFVVQTGRRWPRAAAVTTEAELATALGVTAHPPAARE